MRRVLGALVALTALALAVACALVWCDVLVGNVVPVLQALTPVWVVAAAVVGLLAMAVRTRAAVIALVPLVVTAGAAAWMLSTSPHVPQAVSSSAGQRHLRVLSLNAEFGRADVTDVMHAIDEANPDVVVLVEMTAPKLDALDDAGLRRRFTHRSHGMIDDGSRGSVVLSRFGVTTLDADTRLGPYDLQSPVVMVAAPGADVTVRAVHTYPPLRDGVGQWRPQLRRLGAWQRARSDAHLVMAGDFNATQAHPAFRAAAHGLVDAYPSCHGAWAPTWPHGSAMPPFAQIDHVLTRGFVPEKAGIIAVGHTDHAAVWSDLRY